jgi:hypothetical protein
MPTYKQKNRRGGIKWGYMFSLPGSSRTDRRRISKSGFATKREAEQAAARRRIEELQKLQMAEHGNQSAEIPKTLGTLLEEFFAQHVDSELAPKTAERYHDQSAYLDPALLDPPLADISPLHLSREWKRLLESGGHDRRTKASRPFLRRRFKTSQVSFLVHSSMRSSGDW